ncbi:hypothetical protein [Streptomyces scopuliridis]|uniref:hypothetical protein n=1 Tax=Streptomyces scopuliridis TaxID=452529 RepID=UPI0036800196
MVLAVAWCGVSLLLLVVPALRQLNDPTTTAPDPSTDPTPASDLPHPTPNPATYRTD